MSHKSFFSLRNHYSRLLVNCGKLKHLLLQVELHCHFMKKRLQVVFRQVSFFWKMFENTNEKVFQFLKDLNNVLLIF